MSLISDNVIPGNHGKVFGTDAQEHVDLERIKKSILEIEGITDVVMNEDVFPREFTVYTSKMVTVDDVEKRVIKHGFHAIPKELFLI